MGKRVWKQPVGSIGPGGWCHAGNQKNTQVAAGARGGRKAQASASSPHQVAAADLSSVGSQQPQIVGVTH